MSNLSYSNNFIAYCKNSELIKIKHISKYSAESLYEFFYHLSIYYKRYELLDKHYEIESVESEFLNKGFKVTVTLISPLSTMKRQVSFVNSGYPFDLDIKLFNDECVNIIVCVNGVEHDIYEEFFVKSKTVKWLTPKDCENLRAKGIEIRKYDLFDDIMCHCDFSISDKVMKEMRGINMFNKFEIKEVIVNYPATIVFWKDNTKTVVKCQRGDKFDIETGIALCVAKKALGNKGNWYNTITKAKKEYIDKKRDEKTVK